VKIVYAQLRIVVVCWFDISETYVTPYRLSRLVRSFVLSSASISSSIQVRGFCYPVTGLTQKESLANLDIRTVRSYCYQNAMNDLFVTYAGTRTSPSSRTDKMKAAFFSFKMVQ